MHSICLPSDAHIYGERERQRQQRARAWREPGRLAGATAAATASGGGGEGREAAEPRGSGRGATPMRARDSRIRSPAGRGQASEYFGPWDARWTAQIQQSKKFIKWEVFFISLIYNIYNLS